MVEIDITPRPEGAYRLALWTVGPSVERKYPRLQALDAHVVVTPRTGNEARLLRAGRTEHASMAWVGRYPQRGLGAIAFDDAQVRLDGGKWDQRLEWIAPVLVGGTVPHQMLMVWSLGKKAQVTFKSRPQAWQAIQMMRLYERFMSKPTVVIGDFNNNPVFHENDPNWDMLELVALLETAGLRSVYHEFGGLDHGDPRETATRFRTNTKGDVEGHHTDYCFVPESWLSALLNVQVGSRDEWVKHPRPEEHVPVVADFDAKELRRIIRSDGQ